MSFKTGLIKMAIKLTPNKMIIWAANIVLKDIAELTDFNFDLEARKVYVQIQLLGESETIEVWLEDFAVVSDAEAYKLIIQQARSNRIWLNNLLSRITGKAWKIPAMPQFATEIKLISELFEAESPKQEDDSENGDNH
ncbi:hypothetical protein [Methylobacter sp.]|uniref:hypothetical protein n=1 Tax=Methylobacter sp. TaxID=2051955 RepID=UPI002FDD66C0